MEGIPTDLLKELHYAASAVTDIDHPPITRSEVFFDVALLLIRRMINQEIAKREGK